MQGNDRGRPRPNTGRDRRPGGAVAPFVHKVEIHAPTQTGGAMAHDPTATPVRLKDTTDLMVEPRNDIRGVTAR